MLAVHVMKYEMHVHYYKISAFRREDADLLAGETVIFCKHRDFH